MKKLFVTASAICLLLSAKAQFTYDYLKAADDYYRKGDYYSAAQYYEKYIASNTPLKTAQYEPYVAKSTSSKATKAVSSKEQAIYNLAESYRQLNYYIKAEPYFQQAVSFNNSQYPLAPYHYATTLRALGKFEEAEKAFQQFLTNYTTQDKYTEAANREIQNLRYIQTQLKRKDLNQFKMTSVAAFASEGANYAPFWASGSKLYFTTTRPDEISKDKEFINKIYEATYDGSTFAAPVKMDIEQPSEIHQGGQVTSADGSTLFVTRWTIGEGKKSAGIYMSKISGTTWTEPVLVKGLAAGNANDKQPFLLPDGKLIFASDREGGLGGFDLWTANINETGEATNITNLGAGINTAFDEEAPYYHVPSNTLVFATNGRVGMGGFDLFFSKARNGGWSTPENFGYPVNSIKNDMYFASRGGSKNILENVLLSSDRNAECCLQLLAVSKIKNPKMISGIVVDCQTSAPLASAIVEVKGAASQPVFSGLTTQSGSYNFTLKDFENLKISANMIGYTPATINVAPPADDEIENFSSQTLCLNKIPEVGTVEVLENVYFAYDKAEILDESHSSLDKLVKRLNDNPSVSIEISGHTDNKGNDKYNQKLSEARAQSVVEYLVKMGIDRTRLTAKGYGSKMPIAPNSNPDGSDNPQGREKNRRTEFRVIKN